MELIQHLIPEVIEVQGILERQKLTQLKEYSKGSVGSMMETNFLTIHADMSLEKILQFLRGHHKLPDHTDVLMVVDENNYFLGGLLLTHLLSHNPEDSVRKIISKIEPILVQGSTYEAMKWFKQYSWSLAPVVNQEGKLVGCLTMNKLFDGRHERSKLYEEEDTFAPVLRTTYGRALWLGVNLLTAFLAAWVVNLFEGTLEKIVTLAVLMPIVTSMGGIAGTQTLTVVIRAMALGKLTGSSARLLKKELIVSILNGILWALVIAIIAVLWFNDFKLGMIIGGAIIINLFCAALSGTMIPLLLRLLSIDPALAGGVVLTTVTDVVGFTAFLGLATLFLIK